MSVSGTLLALERTLSWWQFKLYQGIDKSIHGPRFPTLLLPQHTLYMKREFYTLLQISYRDQQVIVLPVVGGISLAASVAAMGLVIGFLAHSLYLSQQMSTQTADTIQESTLALQLLKASSFFWPSLSYKPLKGEAPDSSSKKNATTM